MQTREELLGEKRLTMIWNTSLLFAVRKQDKITFLDGETGTAGDRSTHWTSEWVGVCWVNLGQLSQYYKRETYRNFVYLLCNVWRKG